MFEQFICLCNFIVDIFTSVNKKVFINEHLTLILIIRLFNDDVNKVFNSLIN